MLQFSGAAAERAAVRAGELIQEDWEAVRALQRSPDGAVLKVSGRPTDIPNVIRAAGGATVVSRAALGLSWIAFAPGDDLNERVAAARQALSPRACTVLDGAGRVDDPLPGGGPGQVVMERLKARFDPARIFRPGSFVGGL
jgi:glycolate oxidase FAD binding subunit